MFQLSPGEWMSIGVLAAGFVGGYAVLKKTVADLHKRIDEDCATNASVEACAASVDNLRQMVEKHYATQISVAALQGTVNTLTAQYSSMAATLTRVENKLDSIIMGNVHMSERRGG